MADAAGAAVPAPLLRGLPDEIGVWEILVRLPPKYILRCRAVCRAWHGATSARDFLLAHHHCQPSLPIIFGSEYRRSRHVNSIHVFDHRAADAQLQHVARLQDCFVRASCDGLLILYNCCRTGSGYSVCNLATRQHAPLRQLPGFRFLDIYAHHPTGEYRLLLHSILADLPPEAEDRIGCCVLALGSDQPPMYIGAIKGIWVLQDYEDEVWERLHSVKLPVAEIRRQFGWLADDDWDIYVVSVDGDVLLLAIQDSWMVYVDVHGELVAKFHRDRQLLDLCELRLKQTLVQHTFFQELEDYAVNALPFV